MARSIGLLAALLLTVPGCVAAGGDGPDLTGTWRVVAHTANDAGCSPGAARTDPPFIRFLQDRVAGLTFYHYVPCTDATTCAAPDPFFDLQYAHAITDGYQAILYRGEGDLALCELSVTVSDATVAADGTLAIATHRNATVVMGVACNAEEAQREDQGTWPCERVEAMSAVRE